MIKYLPFIFLFSTNLFFAISVLIRYEYEGRESSLSYIIYNISLFFVAIILFFIDIFIKNTKYSKKEVIALSLPVLVTFLFLLSHLFSLTNELGTTRYLYFILWSIPAIYVGVLLAKTNRINELAKFLEILMVIFSIATFIVSINALVSGDRVNVGGATYQNASYMAAFAFGLNLYFIFFGENFKRFCFNKTKVYKVISILLLFMQVISVITSGGRGATILLIVYSMFIILNVIKNTKQLFKLAFASISVLIILINIWPYLMTFSRFEGSVNRVFKYISPNGIDWTGTSGRDIVYSRAIELIFESPIVGYGVFGMWKAYGFYPHNIFLEVLLQGGIIYLTVFIISIMLLLKKLRNMVRYDEKLEIIIVLALYPLVLLMFSGTYLNNSLFWFIISYVISYSMKARKVNRMR